MPSKPLCCLMSYDYQDVDVIINCRLFYSAVGFRTRVNQYADDCGLLVVLRGDPGQAHCDYRGAVHVYDYEKGRVVDWRSRFPKASEIILISLIPPEANENLPFICSYVPVIPAFWQVQSSRQRSQALLHIANYKFLGPDDDYHQQLLALIRQGHVAVYGGNWQHIGLQTQPLSYWSANRMLATAQRCIGLMYPNQRGRTLSGRMWQAPIQGCHVISESGTNLIACPGVLEVPAYTWDQLEPLALDSAELLRVAASTFWQERTERLARLLGLTYSAPSARLVLQCRSELLRGHGHRRWQGLRQRLPGPRRLLSALRRRLQDQSGAP